MKRLIHLFQSLLIIFCITNFGMAQVATTSKVLRIAIVADGPWERNQELIDLTKKEITDVIGGQVQIFFPGDKQLVGDWTLPGVKQIDDRLLTDPNVDLIIGLGLMASQDLATRGDLPKPVDAESKNVAIARSNLLPQIDLSAIGFQLDKDRALAGYQPDRSATAEAVVTQVLFSEPAMANLSIQSSLYKSRQSDLEVTRLNTIVAGATACLNLLRTQKIYFILLDNLKVTRSNLYYNWA